MHNIISGKKLLKSASVCVVSDRKRIQLTATTGDTPVGHILCSDSLVSVS